MTHHPANETHCAGRRLATVREIPTMSGYQWATPSLLRHAIFNAEDRVGSGGTIIPGNGLSGAIIDDHLRVRWCECETASLVDIERSLIRQLTPLMNTTHNPAKSQVLAALRKECRDIGQS